MGHLRQLYHTSQRRPDELSPDVEVVVRGQSGVDDDEGERDRDVEIRDLLFVAGCAWVHD